MERKRYMMSPSDIPIIDACLRLGEIDTLCHRVLSCRAERRTYQECAQRFGKSRIWYAKKLAKCFSLYEACRPKAINLAKAGELREITQDEDLEQRVLQALQQELEDEAQEANGQEQVEEHQEDTRQDKEEKLKTKSRVDPERQAESAALRKLGVIAAKQAEKLVALWQEIGRQFYERFREIKEVMGIEWSELIEELYTTYVKYGIEREEEITEEDILKTLIEIE